MQCADDRAGKNGVCPNCKKKILIPAGPAAPSKPTPAKMADSDGIALADALAEICVEDAAAQAAAERIAKEAEVQAAAQTAAAERLAKEAEAEAAERERLAEQAERRQRAQAVMAAIASHAPQAPPPVRENSESGKIVSMARMIVWIGAFVACIMPLVLLMFTAVRGAGDGRAVGAQQPDAGASALLGSVFLMGCFLYACWCAAIVICAAGLDRAITVFTELCAIWKTDEDTKP
jgi:hypothetical protein